MTTPRDCKHGQLARQCEICQLETELTALRQQLAEARESVKEIENDALERGYLLGFNASGEGWNGEFPFEQRNINPESDADWCVTRAEAIRALKEKK